MKKTARRFLSMLLALSMVFSLLVFPASAAEPEGSAAPVKAADKTAPAAQAVEDAPSAAETTDEPQEDAPVFTVTDSSFTFKLNADDIDLSGVSATNVQVPEDAQIDEDNREIIVVGEELKNITVLNEDGESVPLTEEQIQTILYLYSQYQQVIADNANIYGVQTPFFLEFNDNGEDGLGILGEMLVLAGTSVDAVRSGDYSYDNLVGMIQNFIYTYKLGAVYYADAILAAQKEALEVVKASGAKTEAQKLLVLNTWLAQNNTFDMPYIMNADSDKDGEIQDDEKLMEAPNGPLKPEHYQDVYDIVYADYEPQIKKTFHDQVYDGVVAQLRQQFYENAIKNVVYQSAYDAGVEDATKQAYVEEQFQKEYEAEKQRVYDEVYEEAYARYLEEACDHKDVSVTFTWNGTAEDNFAGTTAKIVCKTCNKVVAQDAAATVTKDEEQHVDSTCKEAGKDVYIASVTSGETYTDSKEVALPLAEHNYVDGVCSVCGAEEPKETTPEETAPEETVAPTEETVPPVTDEEKAPNVKDLSPEEQADALAQREAEKAVEERDEEIQQTAKKNAEAAFDALSEDEKQALIDQFVDSNEEAVNQIKESANTAAENFMSENKDAIAEDAPGFVETAFGAEAAAYLASECDKFIADAEENGVEVDPENAPGYKMTVEDITQNTMENEPIMDVNDDGEPDLTANQAIPVITDQAASGMTTGVINGWKGCHIGAFGFGTSVCLGYAKAYTYLIQCMHPEIYGVSPDADMTVSSNWKTADELYVYDEDGNLDLDSGYLVDTVRVTFDTEVSMFGPDNTSNFGEVHFWNAVKVDGKWYYIDPCYVDVYVEVMSRDRVETDGNLNHLYFMFSHTSAKNMYDGYTNTAFGSDGSGITSLYTDTATHTDYEDSWMSRINCTPYFADGYVYYVYDSTDLLTILEDSNNPDSFSDMDTDATYKLVRHKLTDTDAGDNGDSDYDTLITFNYETEDGELEARVYNPDTKDMVKNEWLTELVNRHLTYAEVYPAVEITSVLYGGKLYFNLYNCILSFDLETYEVALVKEYNTVYGVRDDNVDFGGRAFSVTTEDKADFTVENHPIAALNLVDDELTVSIATNFALISGKKDRTNPAIKIANDDGELVDNGYGYEYEESNYNPNYNTFFNSDEGAQYGYEKEVNDNDEFMWSANFVEKLSMSHLTGSSHTYETVTVEPFCGIDGFTEERCTDCGAVKADSRVYDEGTAHEHHFIRFDETYYTKDDGGSWNKGTCYVCPMCGYAVSEPSEPGSYADEEEQAEYAEKLAEYEAAAESAGHTYVPADAVWSEDGTSVSFRKLECSSNCLERKPYLDALLNDDSISVTVAEEDEDPITAKAELKGHEGDCTTGAIAVYVASGEVNGYAYTATYKVQLRPSEHIFGDDDICKVCGTGRIYRLSGKTRYETSFAIADKLKETLEVENFDTIVVAYGGNYPDALAGSYLAAQLDAPILLTQEAVDSDVLAYIQKNLSKNGTVYILGGSAAVSDAFADGLKDAGIAYERLSGKTRYETGLKILEKAGLNGNEILVCTGESFADALAVSAANKPILLVNGSGTTLTDAQKKYLNALDGEYTFYIIGGTAAVSAELEVALGAYGNVKRISGKGRYETSVAVAETFFTDVERVSLAYAQDYPDGLCGGALASKLGAPVLLVESGKESAAADYVAKNGIKRGVVFGGTGRITDKSVRTVFDLPADAEIELIRYS